MKINKIGCFIVAFLAALSGILFANHAAITRQLDDWQVLPQPARFSQLYFTDERQLPSVVKIGSLQKLTFTIHNLEHRTTNYNYKVIAVSSKGGVEQLLDEGTLTLHHNHAQTANSAVLVPALDTRLAMKVKVEYEGIPLGERQPRPQTQSIFFWAKTEGSLSVSQGGSGRDA
jgi:hypothetical protein